MKSFEDKSCGVIRVEETCQTKKLEHFDQSSEISISYHDSGTGPSDDHLIPSISSSSQIPTLEKFSKFSGNEYSDKSTSYVKMMHSKSSEVLLENQNDDFNLELMKSVIRAEISSAREDGHNMECSNCRCKPIYGVRYSCKTCFEYNLCSECEEVVQHEHLLLKLKPGVMTASEKIKNSIVALGFTDYNKIQEVICKYNFNYIDTVKELLEIE